MDQQHDSFNSHSNHCNSADAMATSLAGMTISDRHHGEQLENGVSPMKGEAATGKFFLADRNYAGYGTELAEGLPATRYSCGSKHRKCTALACCLELNRVPSRKGMHSHRRLEKSSA